MNEKETQKILGYLNLLYINQIDKLSPKKQKTIIRAWMTLFKEIPHDVVFKAAETAAKASPRFVPTAMEIYQYIDNSARELAAEDHPESRAYIDKKERKRPRKGVSEAEKKAEMIWVWNNAVEIAKVHGGLEIIEAHAAEYLSKEATLLERDCMNLFAKLVNTAMQQLFLKASPETQKTLSDLPKSDEVLLARMSPKASTEQRGYFIRERLAEHYNQLFLLNYSPYSSIKLELKNKKKEAHLINKSVEKICN